MSATEVQQKRGHVALLLHLRCYNNTAICTGGHGSPAEPNRKPKDGGGLILWSMLGALTLGIVTVFYDGEKAKISRAVTTYYALDQKSPLAKIRNVDTMNMIKDDIKASFENDYVGKVPNSYANKMTLVGMINQVYLDGLKGDVLNPDYDNAVDIDVQAHKDLARNEGMVVSEMSEMDLRRYDTGSAVYLAGNICFLDTMEDLTISFVID